jgi:hypothetical protein
MKWKVDEMANCQSGKLTKWQIDEIKLTKVQV